MDRKETWHALVDLGVARGEMPDGKWDLRKAKLSGADLSGADLSGANLSGADLSGANLSGANLFGSNFFWANLRDVDLSGCFLSGCFLGEAKLSGANLRGARLLRVDFSGINLSGADLSGAKLLKVDFSGANLTGANLSGVDLHGAKLCGVDLSGVDLSGFDLSEIDLSEANLTGADLSGAKLNKANLNWADLGGANLFGTEITGANLSGANLSNANLSRARLCDVNLENAKLTGATVYEISARDLRLQGTEQTNLVITPAGQPVITVDNLNVAQFLTMLIMNLEVREVVDTIASRTVLLLGLCTPRRKALLEALCSGLRQRSYTPVLFHFEGPMTPAIRQAASTMANMAKFIIAEMTDSKNVPQTLTAIVPGLPSVPVLPIGQVSSGDYRMLSHFRRFPWVLPIYRYTRIDEAIDAVVERIISPAESHIKR